MLRSEFFRYARIVVGAWFYLFDVAYARRRPIATHVHKTEGVTALSMPHRRAGYSGLGYSLPLLPSLHAWLCLRAISNRGWNYFNRVLD